MVQRIHAPQCSFAIPKTRKQPKCPTSIERGMDKEDVVQINNGISVIKKNGILPFAAMWVDVVAVILNEVSQRRRNII